MLASLTSQPKANSFPQNAALSCRQIGNCINLERLQALVEKSTGYDATTVNALIAAYIKWLALKIMYKNERLVPTQDIDIVWHQHILDSEQYVENCVKLAGEYLHHRPHLQPSKFVSGFERTKTLWRKHFREELSGEPSICD